MKLRAHIINVVPKPRAKTRIFVATAEVRRVEGPREFLVARFDVTGATEAEIKTAVKARLAEEGEKARAGALGERLVGVAIEEVP